jgi:imidazolonepropionase-like amidohydrolase
MRRLLISLALVLAVALPASADEVVIRAAKVYTLTGPPLAPGTVRVKDGVIVEVGPRIATPAGARFIDIGAGVLIPGLVDAASAVGVEGETAERTAEVTPDFRVLDAVDWSAKSFRRARSEGTTTVALLPGTDNVVAGRSCVVKTSGGPDLRVLVKDHALVITLASDPANGNNSRGRPDSIYNRQPTNRMGVVWMLRSEFGRAKANGPVTSALAEASAGKRPVVCVSRMDNDIEAALRLRSEHGLSLTIAGAQEGYKVAEELAAAKVPVLLGPLSTDGAGGPEREIEAVLNNAGALHKAGVPFALTGGRLLDQARFAARFGLPQDVALAAVTATPAKLLGVEKRVGAIAPGRDADLVALSGDPFDLTATVRWTMVGGELRPEDQ